MQTIAIIGAGPAGEAAATTLKRHATGRDNNVYLIERDRAGGLCLNKGCIPSKTLLEHVHTLTEAKHPINWNELQKFKTEVVTGIRSALEARLKREGVQLVHGAASFKDASTLFIQNGSDGKTISFDKAILTAGTEIFYPPALEPHKKDLLTSDTILEITETPRSILIIGGGAVGLEFACLLNAAGSQVIVIEMQKGILPGEDPAVVQLLTTLFEGRGISIRTETTVSELKKSAGGWEVSLSNGDCLNVQHVLACVGRVPSFENLGLDKGGVKTEKNKLILTPRFQTTNANVYAAGDVAGSRLAHHASAHGEVAALNALGESQTCDDRFVPRCLYSWPEVASVGAWKYQLEEKNQPVKTSRAFFKGSAKALAAGETDGFVQVVSDPASEKILGAQIIGPHATELIHIFSVALKAEFTTRQLGEVMFAHPTLSETIREAVRK